MRKIVMLFTLLCIGMGYGAKSASAMAILRPQGAASDNLEPRSMRVETQIGAGFAKTVVTTTYSNPNQHTTEADFIYAAPPHSVVTGFAYWNGDEKVVARVEKKERSNRVYNISTLRENDPALVEMMGKNTFRAKLSPVLAKLDLKVEVTLLQPLSYVQEKGKSKTVWSYPLLEETRDVTLDALFVRVHFQTPTVSKHNFSAKTDKGDLVRRRENFKPTGDLRVESEGATLPLKLGVETEHINNQGYFAIHLFSDTPQQLQPRFVGAKASTHISQPEWISPREMLIYGRYEGKSTLQIQWGENTVKAYLPREDEADRAPAIASLSAPLWAAHQLELLGKASANREMATLISNGFNLPCAWTSWLAMPAEQRKILDEQNQREDFLKQVNDVANKFVLLLESGQEYSPEGLQYRAQLRDFARSSKGRKYGIDEEATRNNAIKYRMKQLAKAVQARKLGVAQVRIAKDSEKLRRLEKRSEQSAHPYLVSAYGESSQKLRQRKINQAALAWKRQVMLLKDETPSAQKLKSQLRNLCNRYGVNNNYEATIWKTGAAYVATELMSEALAGREDGLRAAMLRDAGERFVRRSDFRSFRSDFYRPAIQKAVGNSSKALLREIESGRDTSVLARNEKQRLNELFSLAPDLRGAPQQPGTTQWQIEQAWQGRAREMAYRLSYTKRFNLNDTQTIAILQRELDRLSANTEKESSDYESEQARLVRQGQPLLTARQYRKQVETENLGDIPDEVALPSNTLDSNGFSQNYVRPGDPLIEVAAPRNSAKVVAILPSGEIKKLTWNENTKKWEARFDVPTATANGSCFVRIIIVDSSGGRRSFTMTFNVDKHAPKAIAEAMLDGNMLHLSLQADAGTERVKAITPWRTTINLRRSSALTFAVPVEVPKSWRYREAKVKFILTDKAHNRTEKVVQVS